MPEPNDSAEKCTPSAVSLDGNGIRRIREEKKLTQLYVASVVGVTTDTISRWENNRYPSVKRDNAEKLAGALEVPLDELLRREEPTDGTTGQTPDRPRHRWRWRVLATVATVFLLLAFGLLATWRSGGPAAAVCWAPPFAAPGEVIPMQIQLNVTDARSRGAIIREQLPPGWVLVGARPPSSGGQRPDGTLQWLIPAGGGKEPRVISFTVRVAAAASHGDAPLGGTIVLESAGTTRSSTIGGVDHVRIGPYHWADSNGDGRIDDNEIIPAYYLTEGMKGLGLDWPTIEAIWSGRGYRFDEGRREYQVLK